MMLLSVIVPFALANPYDRLEAVLGKLEDVLLAEQPGFEGSRYARSDPLCDDPSTLACVNSVDGCGEDGLKCNWNAFLISKCDAWAEAGYCNAPKQHYLEMNRCCRKSCNVAQCGRSDCIDANCEECTAPDACTKCADDFILKSDGSCEAFVVKPNPGPTPAPPISTPAPPVAAPTPAPPSPPGPAPACGNDVNGIGADGVQCPWSEADMGGPGLPFCDFWSARGYCADKQHDIDMQRCCKGSCGLCSGERSISRAARLLTELEQLGMNIPPPPPGRW